MSDQAYPKQIFYSEQSEDVRSVGRQKKKKRYNDYLKDNMKAYRPDWKTWEKETLKRTLWRDEIRAGVKRFEAEQHHAQKLRNERTRRYNPHI